MWLDHNLSNTSMQRSGPMGKRHISCSAPNNQCGCDTSRFAKFVETILIPHMTVPIIHNKPEKLQIQSEEAQPLVLVQPPTVPCTFGIPYKRVEVKERSQIFYTTDTFVLDDPDAIDSFVLEVPNELLNLKEGVHASLPKYVDAPFVVDISKGKFIT
ncbi:hypothetical protein Scep_009849 [Stephania cephalantha]|uniref:Uncharacterized protein n=1 Tax=Stephania cephalantha TaxID=152367 RepID=A0AAP0PCU9_9MAGN